LGAMLLGCTNAAEVVSRNAVALRIVTPSVDTAAVDPPANQPASAVRVYTMPGREKLQLVLEYSGLQDLEDQTVSSV
jgi:hypothetical protein